MKHLTKKQKYEEKKFYEPCEIELEEANRWKLRDFYMNGKIHACKFIQSLEKIDIMFEGAIQNNWEYWFDHEELVEKLLKPPQGWFWDGHRIIHKDDRTFYERY